MTIISMEDIAAESRGYLIPLGMDYASERTLAQLIRSLAGIGKHRVVLRKHNLTEQMELWGQNLRESIEAAIAERDQAVVARKVTNAAALAAKDRGKQTRRAAQSAFSNARFFLLISGDAEALREIDKVLHETRTSGADLNELERQLGLYLGLLAKPAVRAALGDAAASVEADLTSSIAALSAARETKTGSRGTPAETAYINLLDGLAVIWVREIRKIARVAADAEGNPAIATDNDLRELYKTTARASGDAAGGEGEGGDPAGV